MKKNKYILILLVALFLASCSSNKNNPSLYNERSTYKSDQSESSAPEENITGTGMTIVEPEKSSVYPDEMQKKIITSNMDIKVKDIIDTDNKIRTILSESGGYIEYSDATYNESASYMSSISFTLKIPVENYELVRDAIKSYGYVEHLNESEEDITREYYDTKSILQLKKDEEIRLLELSKKAELIEEVIEIEKRLSQVRTDINIFEDRIKNMDNKVAYCTLYLFVQQFDYGKIDVQFSSFATKLKVAFQQSINNTIYFFQNLIVWLAYFIIPIVLVSIIIFITYKYFKKRKNKSKK